MPEQQVQRLSTTTRHLDKSRDPWEYVDAELPTVAVRIFSRRKQGTIFDPGVFTPGTPMIMGSIHFTGSHYDFAPGSYALRITRRSVYIGSTDRRNVEIEWRLRHSREGTVDAIPLVLGTYTRTYRPNNWQAEAFGNPMAPLYTFGPGTLWAYFHRGRSSRGTMRVYSSLEGVF